MDFRACGTAEELCMGIFNTPGPLGYEEADVGDGFIKPGAAEQIVRDDIDLGHKIGISGTPKVFENGKIIFKNRLPSVEKLSSFVPERYIPARKI